MRQGKGHVCCSCARGLRRDVDTTCHRTVAKLRTVVESYDIVAQHRLQTDMGALRDTFLPSLIYCDLVGTVHKECPLSMEDHCSLAHTKSTSPTHTRILTLLRSRTNMRHSLARKKLCVLTIHVDQEEQFRVCLGT